MQTLTYQIGRDKRALVKDVQNFKVDFNGSKNWVQARQYEDGLRQVMVKVKNEDGTPFDLTGCNFVFEGKLPDDIHRIIDNRHSVAIDPSAGLFRFDFPAPAFSVAGSYRQAFFRIFRNGQNITTLEFDLQVLADKVISGMVPRDYVTPLEDILDQITAKQEEVDQQTATQLAEWEEKFKAKYHDLSEIYANADGMISDKVAEWQKQVNTVITNLNGDYASMQLLVNGLTEKLDSITQKAEDGDLVTHSELDGALPSLFAGRYWLDVRGLSSDDFPEFKAYLYQYGAGIAQPDPGYFGVKQSNEVTIQPRFNDGNESVRFELATDDIKQYLPDFDTKYFKVDHSGDRRWLYLTSGVSTIGIHCLNATFV